MTINKNIRDALQSIPSHLLNRSGSVFYSGQEAFAEPREIYFLGLNPGGNPTVQARNTVEKHIKDFFERGQLWSEYADESWEGRPPGTWGMQPRVRYMMERLGLEPSRTPSSNVVFVRTSRAADLKLEKATLLEECWPLHQAVINSLGIRVIVCFGAEAGNWVRLKLGSKSKKPVDTFKEAYPNRSWKSLTYNSAGDIRIVQVTHPSIANWLDPAADPIGLVERALTSFG